MSIFVINGERVGHAAQSSPTRYQADSLLRLTDRLGRRVPGEAGECLRNVTFAQRTQEYADALKAASG